MSKIECSRVKTEFDSVRSTKRNEKFFSCRVVVAELLPTKANVVFTPEHSIVLLSVELNGLSSI